MESNLSQSFTSQLSGIEAFNTVIPVYQEVVSTGGGLDTGSQYEADFGNSSIIIPSKSDFICDIELAAKRSLNPTEYSYFLRWYKTGLLMVDQPLIFLFDLDHDVRTKLGAELISRRISPLNEYLAPVDTRVARA